MEGSPNALTAGMFLRANFLSSMVRSPMLRSNHGLKIWLALLTAIGLNLGLQAAETRAEDGAGSNEHSLETSTKEQLPLALVRHLNDIGVVFYGAWSCPACSVQKINFGPEASELLNYVECAKPKLLPDQSTACRKAEIRAYPTWILPDGQRREGVQSIEELAAWTEMPKITEP